MKASSSSKPVTEKSQVITEIDSRTSTNTSFLHQVKSFTQPLVHWFSQNLILVLFLVWTPLLLLQTWNIQSSCFPLVSWGDERCPISSVMIRPHSLSLKPGNSDRLKTEVQVKDIARRNAQLVNRNIVWSSSNKKIATIDAKGQVYALDAGQANVTATSQRDSTKKDTVLVSVEGITDVTLTPKSLAIAVGEVRVVTAAIQGIGKYDNTIVWSSSDPHIASVDQDGSVHGIAKGTATIRATTKQTPQKTATLNVTISEKVVVDRITIALTQSPDQLYVGSMLSLSATVEGLGVNSDDVVWSSSNSSIIKFDHQGRQVNPITESSGEVIITATSNQDKSKKAVLQLTVLPPTIANISLHPNSIELNVDEQSRICPTVIGNGAIDKTITWISSHPEIASVDADGIVTAREKGTTEITATSRQNPNQKAKVILKVPRGFNWLAFGAGAVITIAGTALGVPLPATIALGSAVASGVSLWNSGSLPTC